MFGASLGYGTIIAAPNYGVVTATESASDVPGQ